MIDELKEKLTREIQEIDKEFHELDQQVKKQGFPTKSQAARLLRLWKEKLAKLAMLHGVPEEDAYRQAEEMTKVFSEAIDIVIGN